LSIDGWHAIHQRPDDLQPEHWKRRMNLSKSVQIWLLKRNRPLYFRLKKMTDLTVIRDEAFWNLHLALIQEGRAIQKVPERFNLWTLVKRTSHLQGALAEVGVYQGGSAKVICEVKGDADLHLFDTFEGMPAVNLATDGGFRPGDFADTSFENVKEYLASYPNVHLHKGRFPDSLQGKQLDNLQFRFVHLDVDLYGSTQDCLAFFYPRMVRGGVIISHDYGNVTAPGVTAAFDDFFRGKPEIVIPLWDTQCVVSKM
jgi:O-methyltransferase